MAAMVTEGDLLWAPDADRIEHAQLTRFRSWLEKERNLCFPDYEALRRWSATEIEAFWGALWDYFGVMSTTPLESVLDCRAMPGARWFSGSSVNFAECLLRHVADGDPSRVVLQYCAEDRPLAAVTAIQLLDDVRRLATQLRALGIEPGDRVASYMPATPQTVVAMIATIAIGAVWSSASPEFGVRTVVDRYAQIEPKLLFAADGYRFGGREYSRSDEVREIAAGLPSLKHVVWLPYRGTCAMPDGLPGALLWNDLMSGDSPAPEDFRFEHVSNEHPLWVVFSSGTTGLPKAIVHSHQGALVEYLKLLHFHMDLGPGDRLFFYTTTGWIMWNVLVSSLMTGASAVLYDGSPAYPGLDSMWKIAAETGTTAFGASPTFILMMAKAGIEPGRQFDLSRLRAISVSGAPATPETFAWCYRAVKPDLWVYSMSGGTEACGAFVGGVPVLPVHAGEIQARTLGMDVSVWSEDGSRRDLINEVGELVLCAPFPSMPLRFWGDEDGRNYRAAYFDDFPGVWRHGDFIKINERGGCYIYGRSDSTLNRHGVRIGTAEIYRAVEKVEGVADSLVVCVEEGEGFFMPLFVKLKPGFANTDELRMAIIARLRADCSPRHVPDAILTVPDIPYTLTAKKMEIPVLKLLRGSAVHQVANPDAMANPKSIDWYADYARARLGE